MVLITFKVNGTDVHIKANTGDNLLQAAQRANVAIDAPCSGNGACGKCRVKLIEGELESPRTRHITEEEYVMGWRLACVSRVMSDVVVAVPDIASAYRSRMKVADISSPKELEIFDRTKAEIQASGIEFPEEAGAGAPGQRLQGALRDRDRWRYGERAGRAAR